MIYLEPQFRNEHAEILNVINGNGQAVGYLSYMYKEDGDLYVLGQLEEEGEKQNFLDITGHFIDGLKKSSMSDKQKDPYVYIHMGGEVLQLDELGKEEKPEDTEEESE